MNWAGRMSKDGRASAEDFDAVVHPNGATAWNAAVYAAVELEVSDGDVTKGWRGMNADEGGRIMRATVRRLVRTFCKSVEEEKAIDPERASVAHDEGVKALEALEDDEFATAAAFALPMAVTHVRDSKA